MRPITEEEMAAGLDAMMAGKAIVWSPSYTPTAAPTEPLQRDWLRVATRRPGEPSMRQILLAVSLTTGISLIDLKSPRRSVPIVRARMMFFWLARYLTSFSLPQIGRFVGGKDHSTVMHGIAKVNSRRKAFDPELGQIYVAFLKERPEP